LLVYGHRTTEISRYLIFIIQITFYMRTDKVKKMINQKPLRPFKHFIFDNDVLICYNTKYEIHIQFIHSRPLIYRLMHDGKYIETTDKLFLYKMIKYINRKFKEKVFPNLDK
jgi:hypothetical protein